ncbi:MAG: flippase-like domain-containing protein [Candidatus Bathyarchaeota archaeon]|nr:flippase-like domain-containing protein [Candidatus Bathyarchaeota archaeon]MDW8040888.1 lysylphosphatidylglycerol synthase transmembrane domain-containing protein [Nitrososphaerota archaeon]
MVSTKPKISWKTLTLPLIGIAAFLVYLYLFQVDIPEIVATIQKVDVLVYFAAALLIFVDTFLYAMAWRVLLTYLSVKISVLKSYLYVWYGTFMDLVIPAESISGEITRVYLTTREQGNGVSGKVVASLVAHRLISMGVGLTTIVVGIGLLLAESNLNSLVFNLSLFLIATTLFFLFLLLLLCVKKDWTLGVIDRLLRVVEHLTRGKWKLGRVRSNIIKAAETFHDSMREFGRAPKVVAFSVFWSSLSWLSYLAISYMVFAAIRFPTSFRLWSIILVTQAIVTAIKSIPMGIPFEVGLPEITMTTLYAVLGIPMNVSATSTILNRLLTVWLRFFVGFAVQQWIEIKAVKASMEAALTEKA